VSAINPLRTLADAWHANFMSKGQEGDQPARWSVRQAIEGDIPAWAEMLASLHPEGTHAEFVTALHQLLALDDPYVGFLAFSQDARAIGMIDARVRNYAEGSPQLRAAYVEDLWVEPGARGLGIGRALLTEVENWARTQGLCWLGSDTWPSNIASRSWHVAVGFHQIEELVVYGKPLD
jgi:aminoglycoside 6'-N-acetyltransferase I